MLVQAGFTVALGALGVLGSGTFDSQSNQIQVPLKGGFSQDKNSRSRPNIVFILTDDQDLNMQSLDYMPLLQKHMIDQGTFYKRHYCTTAVCCPARVTLWTGRVAHNTNVTDVNPPHGTRPRDPTSMDHC